MKFKNNLGVTLIEILVAMSIISLIILVFYTSINASIKASSKNEKDISILNIAQSEIEKIRKQIKDNEEKIYIYNFKPDIYNPTKEEIEFGTKKTYYISNNNANNNYYKVDIEIPEPEVILYTNSAKEKKIYTVKISIEYENDNISKKRFLFEVKIFS